MRGNLCSFYFRFYPRFSPRGKRAVDHIYTLVILFLSFFVGMLLESPQCLHNGPKCLTVAPGNTSEDWTASNMTSTWCYHGGLVHKWLYKYNACAEERIGQRVSVNSTVCDCIDDPVEQCLPDHVNKTCSVIFYAVASVQLVIVIAGIILNAIIITNFCRKRFIRSKISNILLLNQAVADLVNCITFAMPNAAIFLYST